MRTLLLFSALFVFNTSRAQQGFFSNVAYAWMWAAPSGANVRFTGPITLIPPPIIWADDVAEMSGGSFAAGQSAWVEAGYRFSERLGFSIAGRYVFAPQKWQQTYGEYFLNNRAHTTLSRRAENPFFLEPGIKLFVPLGVRTEAHIRLGALLPLRHSVHTENITEDTVSDVMLWQASARLRTRFGIGGFGGIGLTTELGAGFGLFIQGDFGLLSLRARDEVVENLVGPAPEYEDLMPRLDEGTRVVQYVNQNPAFFNTVDGFSYRPTYLVPFNFWSAELGVRWALE